MKNFIISLIVTSGVFCIVFGIAYQNNLKENRKCFDELASMVHNDLENMNKYVTFTPNNDATSVDVRIKQGEALDDVVCYTDKHVISVNFMQNGKLCRTYDIRFENEEIANYWSKKGIQTNKRFVKLNFIQE